MNQPHDERWGAATGYLVFILGIAAAAFERGAPPMNASFEETFTFIQSYHYELRMQSLLFVLSAGLYLWFFGTLRSYLLRYEGASGRLANVAFGAGVVWVGLQMVFQSIQVALAVGSQGNPEPALVGVLAGIAYALSLVAYVPMAVMLAAIAAVALRTSAFPSWLVWLAAATALLNLVMAFGIVVDSGPLVPGAMLTYVLYALMAVWQVAVTTVLVMRLRHPPAPVLPGTPEPLKG